MGATSIISKVQGCWLGGQQIAYDPGMPCAHACDGDFDIIAALQLAERNAMVAKLQSQLDMAVKMLKGASSPGGLQLTLPAQLASPGANSPGLASMRLSYAGSSAHGPRAPF